MTFDFNKAMQSAAGNPALAQFLTANKDQLLTMTEQAIVQIIVAYIGGDAATVVSTWFGNPPMPDPANAASTMVGNTADIAQRRYDCFQRAMSCLKLSSEIIIMALSAGVVL